jgi:transcriptional regulator with XRE-family HTH domain
MDSIPKKIIEVRKKHKLSQDRLADLLGYSRSYVANIESGRVKPSRGFLEALQRELAAPTEWILKESLILDLINGNKGTENPTLLFVYAFTKEGIDESEIRLKEAMREMKTIFIDASPFKTINELYKAITGKSGTVRELYYQLEKMLIADEIVIVIKELSLSKISKAREHVRSIFKISDDFHILRDIDSYKKRYSTIDSLPEFCRSSLVILDYPSFMEKDSSFQFYAIPIYLLPSPTTHP